MRVSVSCSMGAAIASASGRAGASRQSYPRRKDHRGIVTKQAKYTLCSPRRQPGIGQKWGGIYPAELRVLPRTNAGKRLTKGNKCSILRVGHETGQRRRKRRMVFD